MRLFSRETKRPQSQESGAVADVLKLAAERIDEIVQASERAAGDIRSASSERLNSQSGDAGQINRERIVAELAQSLVQRADDLREEAAQLADVLNRASGRLGAMPTETSTGESPETVTAVTGPPVTPKNTSRGPDLSARVSERFESAKSRETSRSPGSRVPFRRRATAPEPKRPDSRKPSNEGLRLLATQMAVAGSTREEIEARLRTEFGVEDPSAIFGGLSIPSSR